MKQFSRFIIGGVFFWCMFNLTGCATSELVDEWSDPSFQSPPLKRMLVISTGKNPVYRRLWEDAFSVELVKHNVAATPSYRIFPDAVPDTDQVLQTMKANEFDGVIVTRWLPPQTKTQYMQGYVTNEQTTRYDRRHDRFVTYYRDIEHGGYVDSQKVDIRAIDVWATKNDGQMIWSATCKTPEPNAAQSVRPEIVKLVMSELTQQGIIPSER